MIFSKKELFHDYFSHYELMFKKQKYILAGE